MIFYHFQEKLCDFLLLFFGWSWGGTRTEKMRPLIYCIESQKLSKYISILRCPESVTSTSDQAMITTSISRHNQS